MKQVEVFNASRVEQELAFVAWCEWKGIKRVLFDGDDTLWQTVPIFRKQMDETYDLLAEIGIMSREEWKQKVVSINNELFERHGVNPNRWSKLMDRLANEGLPINRRDQVEQVFNKIYQIPPEFNTGAEEGLAFLNKTGLPFGIVTHANEEWTRKKYNWLNLKRFLSFDQIFIVDENGHKTEPQWLDAMGYFGVQPENYLVIGDSPRADITPSINIGVRNCLLIKNSYSVWTLHDVDVDETKTRSIGSINDLRWLGKEMVYRNG